MSALAHGWNPPGKHPSRAVAEEFHRRDKAMGIYEHATGGPVGQSPLSSVLGPSGQNGAFGNPLAVHHIGGNPNMSLGMAHMRMPRIPIADTMRNIDQHIGGASAKLPMLGNKLSPDKFLKVKGMAKGGEKKAEHHNPTDLRDIQALQIALAHLSMVVKVLQAHQQQQQMMQQRPAMMPPGAGGGVPPQMPPRPMPQQMPPNIGGRMPPGLQRP